MLEKMNPKTPCIRLFWCPTKANGATWKTMDVQQQRVTAANTSSVLNLSIQNNFWFI